MKDYFENKVAIVTGAASGIGLGISKGLLDLGGIVFMADISQEKLDEEVKALEADYQGRVFSVKTDVSKKEEINAMVEKAAAFNGEIDFLFNNAGLCCTLPFDQIPFDYWETFINVNIWSVINGIYAALPIMRKQGHGHIITTSSIAGLMPAPYQMVYTTTKYAVRALSESLRYEMAHENIRFSCICPGNVATPVFDGIGAPPDAVSVEEAVVIILKGVYDNKNLIIFPEKYRELWRQMQENEEFRDGLLTKLADDRREAYETKGTYF